MTLSNNDQNNDTNTAAGNDTQGLNPNNPMQNNAQNMSGGNPPSTGGSPDASQGAGVTQQPNLPSQPTEYAGSPREPQKKESSFTLNLETLSLYSVLIILLVISALLIFFVIVPQYNGIQENRQKIERKESELKKVTAHAEYLESLYSLKDQLEENIQFAQQAIPIEPEIPYYQNQLLQMAYGSSVDVMSLSFAGRTESTENTNANLVKANMSVTGTYDEILTFLKTLENSRRVITAENIRISIGGGSESGGDPENDGLYTLSLTLTSYYMPTVDAENLSIEVLTSKPRLEPVIKKISTMDFYEPRDVDIEIGTDDPFLDTDAGTDVFGNDTNTSLSGNEGLGTGTTNPQNNGIGTNRTPVLPQ